jgi:type I restriction enzyme S subunit
MNNNTTYKDSPLGKIPSDWEVKTLGEVFLPISSFSFSRDQMTIQPQKLRYIHYGDIHNNNDKDYVNLRSEELPYILDNIIPDERINAATFPLLENGDVLLTDASEDYNGIGKAWEILDIADQKVIAGLHTIVLRNKTNEIAVGFGRYIFKNHNGAKLLKRIAQGTKVYSISFNHISKLPVAIPPLPEQSRIAEVLGTWDKAITNLQATITQKELRNKWLMQQLLTGKKRLKGFENTIWKAKSLGECIKHIPREVKKPDSNFFALGIRSHGKGIFHKNDFDPEDLAMDVLYEVKENDLVVNITFAWEHAIAIASKVDDGGLVSHRFPTYTFKTQHAIPEFFKYFILQKRFKYELDLISPGGAGRNRVMSKKDLPKIEVIIPDVKEQTAIANVLQTASNEVQLLQKQLDKLREQKKGLMQVLLTGKKRLKVNSQI